MSERIDPREVRCLEGCRGINILNQISEQFGYSRQGYEDGAPILEFLRDNPGACEAILNWLVDVPLYRSQIEEEFGSNEEEEEEEEEEVGMRLKDIGKQD